MCRIPSNLVVAGVLLYSCGGVAASIQHQDLLGGVAVSLCKEYADQPCSVVEDAVTAAVQRAIAAESYPAENVACDVDFGAACPEGALCAACRFLQPMCGFSS